MKIHKNRRFVFPLLALAALVAVSLACGSTAPTSEPPKISTATSESAVVQPLADTPAPVSGLYLGDAIQKGGNALTALAVIDPATPGMFYQPETGKKLVAVEVVVSNVSGNMLGINPLNTTLLDSEGFIYLTELGGIDNQLATLDLNPGEQVRGWVGFKIPENATTASIKFATESFGGEVLQASLTLPPAGHTPIALSLKPALPSSKLGDVIEQFGYSLSAVTVEDPAQPGILYQPIQGYRLVAVEIVLGNVSGSKPLSVNPLYTFLVDSNGFIYEAQLGGRDGQIATADLGTGEKVKGWVSFVIPGGAIPVYIKYQTEIFSSNYLITGMSK